MSKLNKIVKNEVNKLFEGSEMFDDMTVAFGVKHKSDNLDDDEKNQFGPMGQLKTNKGGSFENPGFPGKAITDKSKKESGKEAQAYYKEVLKKVMDYQKPNDKEKFDAPKTPTNTSDSETENERLELTGYDTGVSGMEVVMDKAAETGGSKATKTKYKERMDKLQGDKMNYDYMKKTARKTNDLKYKKDAQNGRPIKSQTSKQPENLGENFKVSSDAQKMADSVKKLVFDKYPKLKEKIDQDTEKAQIIALLAQAFGIEVTDLSKVKSVLDKAEQSKETGTQPQAKTGSGTQQAKTDSSTQQSKATTDTKLKDGTWTESKSELKNESILREKEHLNEDNLEVKSIAKKLYSWLKQNGVREVSFSNGKITIGKNTANDAEGNEIGNRDNTAIIGYFDDPKSKQTVIEVILMGDQNKIQEVENNLLKSFSGLKQIHRNLERNSNSPKDKVWVLHFMVVEKTTAKGGLVGNTKTNPKPAAQPMDTKTENFNYGVDIDSKNIFKAKGKLVSEKQVIKLTEKIPSRVKIDETVFAITDGENTYKLIWEGDSKTGEAIITNFKNNQMVNEDIQKMKHLWVFNTKEK